MGKETVINRNVANNKGNATVINHNLNSENNKLFVAYEKDEFLGFVSSKVDDEDAHWWYLDSLHVNKNARGHGVGTKLIYEVGKYALTNNYKSMSICIVCGNDNAGTL